MAAQIVDFRNYRNRKYTKKRIKQPSDSGIMILTPTQFSQASSAAQWLLTGKSIILNLNILDCGTSQRFLDVVCGISYALGGYLTCISSGIYIISIYDSVTTIATASAKGYGQWSNYD